MKKFEKISALKKPLPFLITVLILSLWILMLSFQSKYTTPVYAQIQTCGDTGTSRATGLVTVPLPTLPPTTKFGTSGKCIISPETYFVPQNVPTFEDLKSIYYDQQTDSTKKIVMTSNSLGSPFSIQDQKIYLRTGTLFSATTCCVNTGPTIAGSGTAVIFVDGIFDISDNIRYGTEQTGLVFVVGGDVRIGPQVKEIQAIIISTGKIYTAYNGMLGRCDTSAEQTLNPLVVKGSLISLSPGKIVFCRKLVDNSIAAEKIEYQPKYLVILRDIFANTLNRWSEITGEGSLNPALSTNIALDSASSSSTNALSMNWSHTTSGTNTLMIVGVSTRGNAAVSNITYAGQNLTKIRHDTYGNDVRSELWYIKSPPTGPNSVVVTLATAQNMVAGATTWKNVNQAAPLGTNAGANHGGTSSTNVSVNITSEPGEMVVDMVATQATGATPAVGSGQYQSWNRVGGAGVGASSYEVGNPNVTMSWTLVIPEYWTISAVSIKPN